MLYTLLLSMTFAVAAGTLASGATTNHDVGNTCYMADLGASVDTYVFAVSALATLEATPVILPVYTYTEGVKGYALVTSDRRSPLFRMARDGLS